MASARHKRSSLCLAALLMLVVLCVPIASASDQTDRSFGGGDGVVGLPLPKTRNYPVVGTIRDLAMTPEGKMVAAISGGWTDQGVLAARPTSFAVARFGRNGAIDRGFGKGGFTRQVKVPTNPRFPESAEAEALAVGGKGNTVVVGYHSDEVDRPTEFSPVLARFRPDGKLDHSFSGDGIVAPRLGAERAGGELRFVGSGGGQLHDVAIARSGEIIAAGAQNERHGPRPAGMVIAYRPDGSVDTAFGNHGRVLFPDKPRHFAYTALRAIEILPDQRIVVAGYWRGLLFLARLTPGGELDPGFGGGNGKVVFGLLSEICCQGRVSLNLLGNGDILLGGELFGAPAGSRTVLARFDADGRLDRGFGRAGVADLPGMGLLDVAVQGDGRIIVAGSGLRSHRSETYKNPVFAAARLRPDGTPERGFGKDGVQTLPAEPGAAAPGAFARLPLVGTGGNQEPHKPGIYLGRTSAAFAALTQPDGQVVLGGSLVEKRELRDPRRFRYRTKLVLTRYRQRHRRR